MLSLEDNILTQPMRLSEVFGERRHSYINEYLLYVSRYGVIPNLIEDENIQCKKARAWFEEHHKDDIKEHFYNKICFGGNKTPEYDDVFYFVFDDLLVNFDTNQSEVRFLFRNTDVSKIEALMKEFRKFKQRKTKEEPFVQLLVNGSHGLDTRSLKISRPKLSINDNYNDDFKEVHQTIVKRLSKKNDKGLVLLHGKPGTGKTNYIRYLIATLKKEVIFLPPNMASAVTNPNLMSVLIDNPNSIFVIEDAENIIIDREQNGGSPVSALLNISDGLLSDCLGIQIICSFNTDISKVDSALMRKGRLIAKYEFKELETEKAQALSKKLGFETEITSPMTLTDIYNQDEKSYQDVGKRKRIGFA